MLYGVVKQTIKVRYGREYDVENLVGPGVIRPDPSQSDTSNHGGGNAVQQSIFDPPSCGQCRSLDKNNSTRANIVLEHDLLT